MRRFREDRESSEGVLIVEERQQAGSELEGFAVGLLLLVGVGVEEGCGAEGFEASDALLHEDGAHCVGGEFLQSAFGACLVNVKDNHLNCLCGFKRKTALALLLNGEDDVSHAAEVD